MNRLANLLLTATFVAALLGVAYRWSLSSDLPEPRYVLIHADDAGLCAAANRATIRGMEQGLVSSASVMVPCPGFEEFAQYARAHPEKDFGVHLTLTSEWSDERWGSVAPAETVRSLLDGAGKLWKSADQFAAHADAAEVETEIRAQISLARSRGINLSHLDNHMNSLFRRPDLIELLVRISQEESLPVRFANQLPSGWEDELAPEVVDAYYAQLKVLWERQNPLADAIESDNYQVPAGEKRAYFLNALRRLDAGVTEIVVHCCERSSTEWTPPDADRREADLMVFCSPEITEEIHTLGVRVIDWKEFQRLARDRERRHW